ncbi:MAG TPA: IclR family transcriptional regulator [bacterium]|nr:IclR family transcriptional regulator [bacterium]
MPVQIQSLERGLHVLEMILVSGGRTSSVDIAKQLGVHKSTVSHLTSTLTALGYLTKEKGGNHLSPGPKAFLMARNLMLSGEVLAAARPALEKLVAETGETAHIAELRGLEVFFLENRYPDTELRVQTQTGATQPAYSTAVGKALLSGIPDHIIRGMYSGVELKPLTDKTARDVDSLIKELQEVRMLGVAFDREEQTPGTGCMASPVKGRSGQVVAAIGISGPFGRVFAEGVDHDRAVLSCAREIGALLEKRGLF